MAFDDSWDRAKQTLHDILRLDERKIVWLTDVRSELRNLASGGIKTAPDFTLHNEVHSDNVVELLGKLSQLITPQLSEYEAYLLAAAAYLHDIGMFISAGRFNATIMSNIAQSLKVCPEDLCDGGSKYQENLHKKPVNYQIRAVHHLVSAYMLDKDGAAQFHLSKDDLPHIIAICRGHRKSNLTEQRCECYKIKPTQFGSVRRDLLAGLLRLADALDFYSNRAPERAFRENAWNFISDPDPIALKHWLHHYFARSVYITKSDQNNNHYLECQISYIVPANRNLHGRSYEDFMRPLLDEFLSEVEQGDFSSSKYPASICECLRVRDLHIKFYIKSELGVGELPEVIINEIEKSGCENALEFINYLESKETKSAKTHMDRLPEVKTFNIMLDGDDPEHPLLLMAGEHGQGKTWLMRIFEQICIERQILCHKFDLSVCNTIEEILDGIWQKLGPGCFPKYSDLRKKTIVMDQRPLSENQRELTQCFFDDWREAKNSVYIVLLLDTYERAAPTIKDWIEQQLLEGIKNIHGAIVVIGGREWPKTSDYWVNHSYRFPLKGVQLHDYKEYAKQRGVSISEDELIQFHKMWGGLPKLFDEYLNSKLLAMKSSPTPPRTVL